LGHDASDEELVLYTLKRLQGIPKKNRTAYLQTSICYFNPANMYTAVETGQIEGSIATRRSHHSVNGYPYRSLFIVNSLNKYYDELTPNEHDKINHRLHAFRQLSGKIKADLIQ